MGRGSSKISGSASGGGIGSHGIPGQPDVWTAGDISFSDMMAISRSSLSDGSISFDRITTILPKNGAPASGKKSDLGQMINDAGITHVIANMYRNQSGANDLQRMFDLGFKIQAQYLAPNTGSAIPPRDYYFLVK